MGRQVHKKGSEQRRKQRLVDFSNYENGVTLISSFEAWFEHRWGARGKEHAGLLDCFNRFPDEDGLTPDFEVRFHTPYVIWGDHKRTIQPAGSGRDEAVEQILKYAARRPAAVTGGAPAPTQQKKPPDQQPVIPGYDIVVLVSGDNDDVAAEAIDVARERLASQVLTEAKQPAQLAPIVILGCYRDPESINGEWYNIKWRNHYRNHHFSEPNISTDPAVDDLNALIVNARSHAHAIRVDRNSLNSSGRNPFINDTPPPLYTVIRLVIPAINALLTDDDRDQLQSMGRVDKTLTRADLVGVELVRSIRPQPRRLDKWVQAALDLLEKELKYAKKLPGTEPPQYIVTIDNTLIKGELRELLSDRAAGRDARKKAKGGARRRSRGDAPGQGRLFE